MTKENTQKDKGVCRRCNTAIAGITVLNKDGLCFPCETELRKKEYDLKTNQNKSIEEMKKEIIQWMYYGIPKGKTVPDFEEMLEQITAKAKEERDKEIVEIVSKLKEEGLSEKDWDCETSREDLYARGFNEILKAINN